VKSGGRPKPAPAAPQTLTTKAAGATVPTAADRVTRPRWGADPAVALLERILGAKVIDAIGGDSRGGDRDG
jgi:hypothetical protein